MSAFDQHIGDLHAVAALAETDGWLADERWVRTQTLREAVRIYRHVRAAGLASLDDADFDAQPGARGQRAENGRVVVPLVAHVNSEHRRGGDRP